jgi:hypothetical protein
MSIVNRLVVSVAAAAAAAVIFVVTLAISPVDASASPINCNGSRDALCNEFTSCIGTDPGVRRCTTWYYYYTYPW